MYLEGPLPDAVGGIRLKYIPTITNCAQKKNRCNLFQMQTIKNYLHESISKVLLHRSGGSEVSPSPRQSSGKNSEMATE